MTDRPVIVLTGATDGIGLAAAPRLAAAGAQMVVIARSEEKLRHLQKRLGRTPIVPVLADLASLASIAAAVREIEARCDRVDVLINNAGVMKTRCELSADGFELSMAVNHLAVHALSVGLLDRLRRARTPRIVNVDSEGHRMTLRGGEVDVDLDFWRGDARYSVFTAYSRSKLANLLASYELASRLAASSITVNALHPGVVRTALGREISRFITEPYHRLFGLEAEEGADPVVRLALDRTVGRISGAYFNRHEQVSSSPRSYDPERRARVWEATVAATGLGVAAAE